MEKEVCPKCNFDLTIPKELVMTATEEPEVIYPDYQRLISCPKCDFYFKKPIESRSTK